MVLAGQTMEYKWRLFVFAASIRPGSSPRHMSIPAPSDVTFGLLLLVQVQALLDIQIQGVVYALRARVFAYPEDLFSVWLMLAARYRGST